jgi:hypothetical protein
VPDWNAIVAGARRHRVALFLLEGLQACGSPLVPDHTLADLRRRLAQAAEAARLAGAFADAGVRVLFLKGVAIPRDARDIDLLADPDRFAAAEAALTAAGYRHIAQANTPRQDAAYRQALKDLHFVHATTGAQVELHDRLADNPHLLAIEFDALWDGREEARVGDTAVATLGRGLLALYLMVHGAGHPWKRLIWLTDLAAALRASGAIEDALASAEAAGLGVAMQHGVLLAHDWLGTPVGEPHLARARTGCAARSRPCASLCRCGLEPDAAARLMGEICPRLGLAAASVTATQSAVRATDATIGARLE